MNKLIRFSPALAWGLLIFGLSSQSHLPSPGLDFDGLDKLAHGIVFGVLAFLLWWGDARPRSGRRAIFWGVAASAYGLLDELHQLAVPNRQPDVWDWIADTVGAMLVIALCFWLAPSGASRVDPPKVNGCAEPPRG